MAIRKTTAGNKPVKRKNAVIKPKSASSSKFLAKSADEKTEIQCLISIGMRECKPVNKIFEDLKARGFKLAISTMYVYIKDIRAQWQETLAQSYEVHVASQFAKLDRMEERLWQMLDASMLSEKKDTTITEKGVITGRREEKKSRNGDVEIMLAIERIWVRRNELLGITSSTINIQNNIQNIDQTTNVQNNVEVKNVEFQPLSEAFHGNFVIKMAERIKQ